MSDGYLETAPIFDDVFAFDGLPLRGKVDVISAGFPCFVAGTMILTRRGYIAIEDVEVGAEVLTHRGRWRRVTSAMTRDGVPLVEVKAQGAALVKTTPEHPFYIRTRSRVWNTSTRQSRQIMSAEPTWADAQDMKAGDMVAQVLPEVVVSERTPAFWRLVGRYLADGWRVDRHNRPPGSGRVVICCGHDDDTIEELAAIISAAGYHATRAPERTGVKFHIVNKALYQYLERFGRLAHGKRLHSDALTLDVESSRALMMGYLSGDGHLSDTARCTSKVWSVSSVSKSLALGIALLAQRSHNVVASVQEYHPPATTVIEGRTVNQRPHWNVRISESNNTATIEGRYGWKPVRSIKHTCEVGRVFNIAVDGDESYTADGCVVHNCQPFSSAGLRRGEDDARNGWPHTARIIREVRPRFIFLENVAALLTSGYFGVIAGDLASSGYRFAWRCISAESVGAPHKRERLWVLGEREGAALADTDGPRRRPRDVSKNGVRSTIASARDESATRLSRATSRGARGQADLSKSERVLIREQSRRCCWSSRQSAPLTGVDGAPRSLANAYGSREPQSEEHLEDERRRSLDSGQALPYADVQRREELDRVTVASSTALARSSDRRSSWWEHDPAEHEGGAQPELGRVVDGVADRMDAARVPRTTPRRGTKHRGHRLKALGNGQVPRVVVEAVRQLSADLGIDVL